ncbi:phosphate ABC transporter permease subunit PstC [Streptomyces sp. TRM66268-LWL]|uniref:Phosphate transport system permease protein n=1 Tax=Streptomyces polyasparticus TaxID=2767826 RepID=A0ABR7S8N1_9ACTN|nr:phosphate ABC transporter permease subunit PstC [Streptomyces polyasparticus]MBC9711469.1 phosphate ABC transporter permease subunit PstC [Streptomyces polyasparticus]
MSTSAPKSVAGTPNRSLRRTRPRYGEAVIKGLLMAAALVSVATTVGIVISLIPPAVDFFRQVSISEFLTGTDWTPLFSDKKFGVLPLVAATFVITGIALLIAVPVGLGAAIYLSEYARPRVRQLLKPSLEVLAGIPTVVYGFFALAFITPQLQDILPEAWALEVRSGLAAGLVMGVMIVPTIASLTEDALSAVPHALREGAFALGSGKRTVSVRVVVPAALSGIVAACVLGISRAVGETMIVLIAAGVSTGLRFNPFMEMETMTAFIARAASGDVPVDSIEYNTIFAVGALLFLATFVMNLIAIRLVRKYREVYE